MGEPIRTGCAGWAIARAQADYFPGEGTHLERYAAVMDCVEINSSFYRPHQPATYARWRDSVPDSFLFSVKLPRTITHDARLREVEKLLDGFVDEVGNLGEKLGCLLIQLPPSLRFDLAVVEVFFKALTARLATPMACEPRHASWTCDEALDLMAGFNVAVVAADPPAYASAQEQPRSATSRQTATLFYMRLHGSPEMYKSPYARDTLVEVEARLRSSAAAGQKSWCIFDNTAQGAALPNALELRAMLARNA